MVVGQFPLFQVRLVRLKGKNEELQLRNQLLEEKLAAANSRYLSFIANALTLYQHNHLKYQDPNLSPI